MDRSPNSGAEKLISQRDQFVARRQQRWDELASLTTRSRGSVSRLTGSELKTLGRRYRESSADLAIARRDYPNDPMLANLERIVVPARALIYDRPPRVFTVWQFLSRRYWQRIYERKGLLLVAVLFLMVPAIAMWIWTMKDPARAQTLYPGSTFRDSYKDLGFSVDRQTAFSSEIFINNIRVSFLAFAAGITFCVGTVYLLINNGMMLGYVVGYSANQGNSDVVFALITGHGILELSVIAVTAMAGMRMGMALVNPGLRSRGLALRREAVAAVEIVIGTIPWFVLAGLIEGFFTPAGFGPIWAGIVGFTVGGIYWVLIIWRGRIRTRT